MSSVTLTNEQFAQLLQQIGRGGGAATVKSELPKFDGDDEQWTSFRDLYESYYASCEQKELLPETQAKYDQLGPNDRKQQRSQLAFHLNQSIVRTTGGVSKAQEIIQSVEDAKKSDGSWLWLQLVNYYDPRREQQKAKDIDAYEDFKLASGDVAKELARYEGAVRKCEAAGQAIGEVMKVNKFKRLLHGLPEYRVFLEIIASETSTAGWDVFKQRLLSASDNAKAAESAADSSTVAALRHKPPSGSPQGERGQGQARGGAQGGPSRFRKEGAAPAQGPDGCWYCGKHKDKWFACKKLKRDIRDNRVDWSQSPYGKEPFGFQRFPNRLRAATVNAVQDEGDEDAHYTVAVVRAVDEPVVSPGGSSGVQATSPVQQSMGSGAPNKVASDARPGPHSGQNDGQVAKGRQTEAGEQEPTPVCQLLSVNRCSSVLSKEKEDDFMVDSGSDKHITWDESKLPDLKQCDNRIETADGTVVNADGIGTLTLQTSGGALVLRGVLLCRSIQHNIISSGRLGKEGKRFVHDTHKKDQSFIEDCNSGHRIQLVDKGIKAYLRETEQPTQHVCETTTTSPSGSASREGAGDAAGLKRGCAAPGAASSASRNDRQGSERRAGPSPSGGGKAGPLAGASTHQGSVPPPKTEQMSEAKTHAVSECGVSCRVEQEVVAPLKSTESTYMVAHNRLHVSDETMKEMERSTIGFQQPSSYPKENYCQPCVDGDLPRKRRGIDRTKSAKSNDVWYADFEPMKESQRGHKGYLIVRDDASGFSCVSLMRNKAEAGQALERVIQVMGNKPKELRATKQESWAGVSWRAGCSLASAESWASGSASRRATSSTRTARSSARSASSRPRSRSWCRCPACPTSCGRTQSATPCG
mmetsp:Transcript_43426/g.123031  ORF Transcript_43426/g.123031 Transcript_43426/m.123031 type:complete len:868 (+) Transcript_43426:451-3054(+)